MSDDKKKTGTEQGSGSDPIGELLEPLIGQIPQDTYIDIPATATATSEEIVSDANSKLEDSLLKIFKKSEEIRLEQQKPLLIAIIVLVAIQLIAFNVIIWLLVSNILEQKEPQLITALLDLQKLQESENQTDAIEAALEALKKDSRYLFEGDVPPPYARGTGAYNGLQETHPTTLAGALREKFERK